MVKAILYEQLKHMHGFDMLERLKASENSFIWWSKVAKRNHWSIMTKMKFFVNQMMIQKNNGEVTSIEALYFSRLVKIIGFHFLTSISTYFYSCRHLVGCIRFGYPCLWFIDRETKFQPSFAGHSDHLIFPRCLNGLSFY